MTGIDPGSLPRGFRTGAAALATAVLIGCGSAGAPASGVGPTPRHPPPEAPPGVDSAVAVWADSVAEGSLVEPEAQDRALDLQAVGRLMLDRTDSLWTALEEASSRPEAPSPDPEAQAASDLALSRGGEALVALDDALGDQGLDEDALRTQTAVLLDSAEAALERAFQLNPPDARTRLWLARVYELQARRLGIAAAHARAADVLEKLTLLTPDQHAVWAMLANNRFEMGSWETAALAYREAWRVYLETRDLVTGDPPPLDRGLVFGYMAAEGDMHVRRLDAGEAIDAYRRGAEFAVTPEDTAFVREQLAWIAWDGNRIQTSMARDSLAALADAGQLETARDGFQALKGEVTLRSASDEIEWRLAIVEYNLGLVDEAADRLRSLVERTEKDAEGHAVEEAYARYLEDFGTLCMNLGLEQTRDRRDPRTALMYYAQATRFGWSGRALAHYEMARLLQANVEAALESAGAALREEASLTAPQKAELYRLLMELHRRTGDFDQARTFRDAYRSITSG